MLSVSGKSSRLRVCLLAAAILGAGLVPILHSAPARATTFSGTMFYTQNAGGHSIRSKTYSFDSSTSSLTLGATTQVANPGTADGLIFAPDGDLLVGGVTSVHKVQIAAGTSASQAVPGASAFHLALDPSGTKFWAAGLPGKLVEVPLNPFSAPTVHNITGTDQFVTGLAFTPSGTAFYTRDSGVGGNGAFGTIDMTTFTTVRLMPSLPAAHAIIYDPFSASLILFGAKHITQIDPANPLVVKSDRTVSAVSIFDQGAADGQGHIFGASKNGTLIFLDYSTTGLVGTPANFLTTPTIGSDLDDIAPLSWLGSHLAPLVTTKVADSGTEVVGSTGGYTIKVSNPNSSPVVITSIQDTLPPGFTYVSGSTTGITTGNPIISGSLLDWTGPFTVPAGGFVTLRFNVVVSMTPGQYYNNATATPQTQGISVTPTGNTALINVVKKKLYTTKTADKATVAQGDGDGYTIAVFNPFGTPASVTAISDTLPPGFLYVVGSTTGVTTNNPSGMPGPNLFWAGPFAIPPNGSISLHFAVTVSATVPPGTYYNEATGQDEGGTFPIAGTGPTAPVTVKKGAIIIADPGEFLPLDSNPPSALRATLSDAGTEEPLEGRELDFYAEDPTGRTLLCRAFTDGSGTAQCGGTTEWVRAVLSLGPLVTFAGDDLYAPTSRHGSLIRVRDRDVP